MVNVDKLRGKIVERRMKVPELAKVVGIDSTTLYRRLNGGGGAFTIEEADRIATALTLTAEELNHIFFAQYVAQNANAANCDQ